MLTLATTTTLGAAWTLFTRTDVLTDIYPALSYSTVVRVWTDPALLRLGLEFALPTLFILLCHEMGHWLACRHYGLDATPPYFLPAPIGLGTFGAFIRIRSPIHSKRQLLDVGVWGPIAGFLALVPVLVVGVALSHPAPLVDPALAGIPVVLYQPGNSLLLQGLSRLFHGPLPPGMVLNPHPLLLAGWVGLFATMLNLLPLAQLDGGHILYAALGELQRRLAWPLWAGLALLGFVWPGWWLWSAIVLVMGARHPRVVDASEPLDRRRRWLAFAALVIFALCFMPNPIRIRESAGDTQPSGRQTARREIEHQGHRSVIERRHLHVRCEAAALDAMTEPTQSGHKGFEQRLGQVGLGRAGEGRTTAALGRRQQGELRNRENAPARVREVPVHLPRVVFEDPQGHDLARGGVDLGGAVATLDSD